MSKEEEYEFGMEKRSRPNHATEMDAHRLGVDQAAMDVQHLHGRSSNEGSTKQLTRKEVPPKMSSNTN